MCTRSSRQRGISLVELIIYIVIVGIAAAGVLLVMNRVTASSADPLLRKQALAIAESLLEEAELMPMTYCDPNDPNAATAAPPTTACTPGLSEDVTVGPVPSTETRGSAANPLDNVADYGGCQMNTGMANACDSTGSGGIKDILGNAIPGLAGYSASIVLTKVGNTFLGGTAVAGDALQVTVTVTAPDKSTLVLDGYRARYAPNGLP